MHVEIRVDRARCMGSGQCVHWAPGVFDQDDDGISIVVDPRGDTEEKIVHAVTSCPVQAITLHVEGTVVRQEDLRDWVVGVRSDDPVVSALTDLCDEHHELRSALVAAAGSAAGGGPDGADAMCALTSAHLRHEEEAYRAITALVDRALVDTFEADHGRIDRALADLAAHRSDDLERPRALRDVARAVDDHIRLEETVLFPVALAALARTTASSPLEHLLGERPGGAHHGAEAEAAPDADEEAHPHRALPLEPVREPEGGDEDDGDGEADHRSPDGGSAVRSVRVHTPDTREIQPSFANRSVF